LNFSAFDHEVPPTKDEFFDSLLGDREKQVSNYIGGLYHKPTGSRLLYGVLDEWGLPARIRNPWTRSPPYANTHKPIIADLKTSASSTKEDEMYLYLSSPYLNPFRDIKMRGFISAQTEVEGFSQPNEAKPAFSGGLDFAFDKKNNLLLETFYTQAMLPPTKSSSWFSYSPPLPEREFRLSAVSLLYNNPDFSVKSDWAWSETFAVGTDIYANLGLTFTPLLPFLNNTVGGKQGAVKRPLAVSVAMDGAGERVVYRDGVNHGAGFRTAGKAEWKGKRNSLLRLDTVLRGPGFGEDFNRSSTGFYYRHPARTANSSPIRLSRVSLSMDRNAANVKKISDSFSGNLGFSILFPQMAKTGPLGVNFSGSVKELIAFDADSGSRGSPSPYPGFEKKDFDTASAACEFTWSPLNFQLKSKFGYTTYAKKDDKWDYSMSAAVRFKHGRLSIKAASSELPSLDGEKWNWTVSWRLEKR
jgi:hypothetical protein